MYTAICSSLPQCSILQLGLRPFPTCPVHQGGKFEGLGKQKKKRQNNARYLKFCPLAAFWTAGHFLVFRFVSAPQATSRWKDESKRAKDFLLSVTMGDSNRPSPLSYPSQSSSDTRETETPSNDRSTSRFSQTPVGFPVGIEGLPGSSENPASAFRTTAPGDRSMNAKVPIPRTASTSTWTSSGRVSRACENCREQKAKCSGHRPTCQRCQEAGVLCSYGDRKREKMAKCVE